MKHCGASEEFAIDGDGGSVAPRYVRMYVSQRLQRIRMAYNVGEVFAMQGLDPLWRACVVIMSKG